MGDPGFEGIEGECLLFSNQKVDLDLKGAHNLMNERCHEIYVLYFLQEQMCDEQDR